MPNENEFKSFNKQSDALSQERSSKTSNTADSASGWRYQRVGRAFEPYGFTSEPHVGAEAIGLALGGDRDQTLAVVVTDRRYRPTDLKDGEVCVFDDLGRKIYLSRDGIRVEGVSSPVLVNTSASVTVDAPLTKCTGNLEVGGNIVAKGDIKDKGGAYSMAGMRGTYNGHTHNGGATPDQKM